MRYTSTVYRFPDMSALYPKSFHISISNPYQAYITRIHKNLRELIRFMDLNKHFKLKMI